MESDNTQADSKIVASLIDLTIDSWRFSRLFGRLLTKLDAGESARYVSQYRYFIKRMEDGLEAAGFRLVNVEGQPYDPGIAATALNLGDFGPTDVLLIDQMIEPIIMGPTGLIKTGTIMLRKAEL